MDLSREEELMKSIMEVSEKLVMLNADNACLDYIKAFCCTVQICFFISAGLVCYVSLKLADFKVCILNIIGSFD